MDFAILGLDDQTAALAVAANAAGHRITVFYDPRCITTSQYRALCPSAMIVDHWEALLGDRTAAAILVGRANHEDETVRVDQLRTLLQAEMPILASHPVVASMLAYFELDLFRQESGCPLVPNVPERRHPAIDKLAIVIADADRSQIGRIEQLAWERFLADRSQRAVLGALVRDVDVARHLCGEFDKLVAMAAEAQNAESRWSTLAVQMSGSSGILARWSVAPVVDAPGARLTLIGSRGKTVLHMPAEANWRIEFQSGGKTTAEEYVDWNAPAEAIDQLIAAIEGETPAATWLDACRDMELADAVVRSLDRGRTVDLHHEEHSEHSTFKGIMAAGGCLVLMAALAIMVVATTVGNLNFPGAQWWPFALAGGLALFLLLQTLKFAFPPEKK